MRNLVLLVTTLILLSFSPDARNKEELADQLLGIWVHQQDKDLNSLRFVKAQELEDLSQGMIFQANGKVQLRIPFGCQLPPHFKDFQADWRVLNKSTVEVDRHFPGEKADIMKVVKLNNRVLRIVWDK